MNTLTPQLNILKVLEEAINIIEVASNGLTITVEEIQTVCNRTKETPLLFLSNNEYNLAETIAIGAVTEQNGSNIKASAAISYLQDLIEEVNDNE